MTTLSRIPLPRGTALTQLKLFLGAYLLYNLGRHFTVGDLGVATDNARGIVDLEKSVGVSVEHSVQGALDSGPVAWLMSNIYLAAQLVVLPGSLIWLYRRSPDIYRRLRDTVLATWLLALPVYALYPVAPPRLAGIGLTDTVSQQIPGGLTGRSSILYNPLAAVPSLHCGFALAIGIALALAVQSRGAKIFWLLWGPLVCLTVLATGNHYVFDIVAGLLVAVLGYLAAQLPQRVAARSRKLALPRRPLVAQPQAS